MGFLTIAALVIVTSFVQPARAQVGIFLNEFDKLRAPDGLPADGFGFTVAISGDTALIGAPFDDDNGSNSGSVYVFVRAANGAWTQQTKLLASDGAAGDGFGASVALSGSVALVGAPLNSDNGANSGSAYIFVNNVNGVWTEQAKLLPSDGVVGDFFGDSIAITGDTAVIGACGDDDNGIDSGSAYVFMRDVAATWTQRAKLLPSDGAPNDNFGASTAIDFNTAVVGAPKDDDNGTDSGSAYIFSRDAAGAWTQQVKLLALDGAMGDEFGASIGTSGATIIVGARFDDDNGNASGSAFIFRGDATGAWTQEAKLIASDGASFDQFGRSVSISGDMAVVGAWLDNDHGLDSGSAYIFVRDATCLWTQQAKLRASDGNTGDEFGFAVALDGATAFVGAPFEDNNNGADAGSTYVFDLSPGVTTDLNGDSVVNGLDLSILLTFWGGGGGFADLNGDGVINAIDLATLLVNWGVLP